ncbi:MAG TPA: type II secretion system F family protein [Abditibacteriaceae bacterium]|jgi:tight adherence protein B
MSFEYIVIGLGLLVGLVLFVIGLMQGPQEAVETAAEKLTRVRARKDEISPDARTARDKEIDRKFAQQEEQRVRQQRRATTLPSMSNVVLSLNVLRRLEEELLQARSPWRASELVVFSIFSTLVVAILLKFLGFPAFIAIAAGLACLALPWAYVRYMKAKYARMFELQLSDTLMLMANSLRAGFSFLQSLEMVSREAQQPIADEFQRLTQEISIGVPVNQALENMGARVKSSDLDLVITAVLIQREVGSSLAEILEVIAGVIGERIRIRGEIRTLTAQGRLTGMVLGFLPVILGFLIHLVGRMTTPGEPSFVQPLIDDPRGHVMLAIGLTLQVIGFSIIMKIVDIKV